MPDHFAKPIRTAFYGAVLGIWFALSTIVLPLDSGRPQASTIAAIFRGPNSEPSRAAQDAPADQESIALLKRMGSAFASVMQRVSPGVVGIQAEKRVVRAAPEKPAAPFDPFSEDFFEYFFRRQVPRDDEPQREYIERSQGSGFIISDDGCILTNHHVIVDADRIVVELVDGRKFDAEVVGTDPESDVAVVRIPQTGLTPVVLGNSDALEVGEWVLAVGNPLGLSHTVTAGIVSAKGRRGFNVTTYENFIQTDAAVNMGNSGGPLVNLGGEAVGMNTFILGPSGGNIGIGFAIPINAAREVADQLIQTGAVERGYLGVIPQDLTAELAEAFEVKAAKGALIAQVVEDSAAARAGLQHGDIVQEFGGLAIDSAAQFRNLVASRKPGEQVTAVVLRDGEHRTVPVTLARRPSAEELRGERPAPRKPPTPPPERPLGLTVRTQTPKIDPADLEAETKVKPARPGDLTGVVISKVSPGSEAARKGLREGYIIREVNRREVRDEEQFKDEVATALQEGRPLLLLVTDGRVSAYVVLKPTEE